MPPRNNEENQTNLAHVTSVKELKELVDTLAKRIQNQNSNLSIGIRIIFLDDPKTSEYCIVNDMRYKQGNGTEEIIKTDTLTNIIQGALGASCGNICAFMDVIDVLRFFNDASNKGMKSICVEELSHKPYVVVNMVNCFEEFQELYLSSFNNAKSKEDLEKFCRKFNIKKGNISTICPSLAIKRDNVDNQANPAQFFMNI